jgi:hypothetical protein
VDIEKEGVRGPASHELDGSCVNFVQMERHRSASAKGVA